MNDIHTVSGRISKRGFTLIELLVVIGILAVLATTVVLVLNPAQILQESRDSQRIADFKSITESIALAGITNPPGFTNTSPQCTAGTCNPFSGGTCAGGTTPCTPVSSRAVNGNGWVAFNFGTNPTMSVLPIDPTNSGCISTSSGFCYASKASATGLSATFELDARLESTKHAPLMINDGGNNNSFYEVGTVLTL